MESKYLGRLSNFLILLKDVDGLSDETEIYKILHRAYDFIPFPQSLARLRRDCAFGRGMRTPRRPVLADRHNVEMFAVLPDSDSSLYASVSEWWSSYRCRRELNVLSSPISEYFTHEIVAETDLREAPGRPLFASSVLLVLPLSFHVPLMVLVLVGRQIRGFVVEVSAACSLR